MANSSRQIKAGAVLSYLAISFNIIAGLIYTPWMVANIGKNNYGLYTMASSLISMFLIDFGMSAAVTRFVAKYNAEGNKKKIDDFLGLIYKLYFIIDIVISIVLVTAFFLIDIIFIKLSAEELNNFKILYIIVAVYSVMSFPFITLNGILNAYEEFIIAKCCEMINKVLSIVLTVLVLTAGGSVRELVLMQAVSGLFTIVLRFYAIKKRTPVKVNFAFKSTELLKEVFGFSLWSTVTSISQRFIINIIPSLIGAITGAAETAVFGVANTIEGYYFTFANAINGFFLPRISRILQKDNKAENLLSLMIRVGRIQIYILGLILMSFIVIGSDFITLWMGEGYQDAYICGIILILPSFIAWPQEIATTALIAENRMKEQAIINVFTSVISLTIGYNSIISLGAIGASLGICLGYTFRVICTNVIYVKFLGIDIKRFFLETFIKQGKVIVPVTIVLFFIFHIIYIKNWYSLLTAGAAICGCYGIVMYIFSFNDFEKALINKYVKKIIRR